VIQNGEIQAIGGINQKIEGFFDVCRLKGLSGDQGVLMPRSNLRNLMLRPNVVSAVQEGKFHIHAVSAIDEGIEVLTGIVARVRDVEGRYSEGSVNDRVQKKLQQYAEQQKRMAPGNSGAVPSKEEN